MIIPIIPLALAVFFLHTSAAQSLRPPTNGDWTLQRLAIARSKKLQASEVRDVVIDLSRTKGRTFVRETTVLQLPGMMWYLKDTGSNFFPSYLARYAVNRRQWEVPSEKPGGMQKTMPLQKLDAIVNAEIRWLGVPISCPGTATIGERFPNKGTVEVIVTSPCINLEYIFLIEESVGLPKRLDIWAPESPAHANGKVASWPRRRVEAVVFVSWGSLDWRIPSKVILESNIKQAFGDWMKSEYAVEAWINPGIADDFFNLNMSWEMNAETWKQHIK
jgi:hypothetical protein